jgi:hypothetical protein
LSFRTRAVQSVRTGGTEGKRRWLVLWANVLVTDRATAERLMT